MEKTKSIVVSILQMGSILGDIDANIKKVETLVDKFLDKSTDVLVLPEVWSVGWACSKFQKSAQTLNEGSIYSFLSTLAKKHNINIIAGSYIVKVGDNYYNTCSVFDREGNIIATYNKNHLYSYYGCDEGRYVSAGNTPVLVDIEGIKFGLTICYDIRFPEIYRAYAKAGADILVNCAAWGSKKSIPWEIMTKSRAIENQCYMVALTQSGPIENGEFNLGESRIIDYKGEELTSIMSGEGVVCAKIDLEDMYKFRLKSPTLNDIKENYEVKILCKK